MAHGPRPWLAALPALAWLFVSAVAAQPKPAEEQIGAWVLNCPQSRAPGTTEPCIMRHRNWVMQPENGVSVALEVQRRGNALVPVVTVRGLPVQTALGGSLVVKPAVGYRFDAGTRSAMTCGLSGSSYACAPEPAAIPAAVAELRKAKSMTIQSELSVPGLIASPIQEQTLDLTGANQMLAGLATSGGTLAGEALPAVPGLDLRGFLDRVLRATGFPNGAADLLPVLMPLFGSLRN